jgi:predicted dehydrogenase
VGGPGDVTAPLRGIVAGAGLLGPYWARELVESADAELVGWVDLERDRARAAVAALGVDGLPVDASLERLLADLQPDFFVNVTSPGAHRDTTIAALERGVPVLTEKPLAASLTEAEAIVAAADRTGRLVMVSQNRRYMPELVAFRDTVAKLGPLSTLTCEFHIAHRVPDSRFLNTFPQPLLLDMAIHLFDGARAITGAEPVSVFCDAYNPPWSWYAGPAAAHAVFRMSGGLRFAFTGNWAAEGFRTSWTGAWRAVGERGSATWAGDGAAPQVEGDGVVAVPPARGRIRGPERFPGLEDALADFVAALRTGRTPAGECHDNLRSLAMCHAAVESATRGVPVSVP